MSIIEHAGKILTVSVVLLSIIVILASFVHLYVKWFFYPNTRRHHHQPRVAEQQSGVTVIRTGLSPSFLKTMPVIVFDPKDFSEGLECAVCLSEVDQGEKTRILPKCDHGFHVECIDMWFYSHTTCPICRNLVSVDETVENFQEESTVFPTNMLFWGDETQVSTLTSQVNGYQSETPPTTSAASTRLDLVIDIPTETDCDEEDHKSPAAVSSGMRSLTRILSGSRRLMNPFSPAIEQRGSRGHL